MRLAARHARTQRDLVPTAVVVCAAAALGLLVALAWPLGSVDTCTARGGHWRVLRLRLDPRGPYRTQPYCADARAPHEQYDVPVRGALGRPGDR